MRNNHDFVNNHDFGHSASLNKIFATHELKCSLALQKFSLPSIIPKLMVINCFKTNAGALQDAILPLQSFDFWRSQSGGVAFFVRKMTGWFIICFFARCALISFGNISSNKKIWCVLAGIFMVFAVGFAQNTDEMTTAQRLDLYQKQFQAISQSQNSTDPKDFAKAELNFITARSNFAQIANQIASMQQNINETNAQIQEIQAKIQELKPKISAIWAGKINTLSIILLSTQASNARIIDTHNKPQSVERMFASKYMLGNLQNDMQEIAQNFQKYNILTQDLLKKNHENQENFKNFNQHHAKWQELLKNLGDTRKIAQNYYEQLATTQKLPAIKGDTIDNLMAFTTTNLAKLTDNGLNQAQNSFIRQFNKKISRPFMGKIATSFGAIDNWGNINKGLTYGGDGQVFAPFDGKISFAREFKQQKIVVIIEHTDGYYSLLSGLDAVFVIENQTILEGEPIGLILPQKTDKSYLYFQLNRQSEDLNPTPYLSQKS